MTTDQDKTSTAPPSPEAVLRFLADNPDFLISAGLDHGGTAGAKIVDLSQAVIQRASKVIRQFNDTRDQLAELHGDNTETMLRVHQAAYLLIAATSRAEILGVIGAHFPAVLDLQAATLVVAEDGPLAGREHTVAVDPITLAALTKGKTVSLGAPSEAQRRVFEPISADSAGFAALPAILPETASLGVLALAGRDPASFSPDDGTDFITFTATMVAIALIARGED